MKIKDSINIIELFSGIGAPRKSLNRLNIVHKPLFISEIKPSSIKAYRSIFNDNVTPNLGDIKKIKSSSLNKYINKCGLLVFGSPCQDFSSAGKNKSGGKGTNTRSSLIWEAFKIIKKIKPKIVLFENVKGILFKKHKTIINEYLKDMGNIGYTNNKPLLLNSLKYGIPQNRERVYTISILNNKLLSEKIKNINWREYEIKSKPLKKFLNIVDFNKRKCLDIKEKLYISKNENYLHWKGTSKYINSSYNRAWNYNRHCGTLTYSGGMKITNKTRISKLTGYECIKLMGFNKSDYKNLIKNKLSDNMVISMSGNSIVVDVLNVIFKVLL